jgi:hypothetical protein
MRTVEDLFPRSNCQLLNFSSQPASLVGEDEGRRRNNRGEDGISEEAWRGH